MKILCLPHMGSFRLGLLFLRKGFFDEEVVKKDLTATRYKDGQEIITGIGYRDLNTHLAVPRGYPVPEGIPEVLDLTPKGEDFTAMENRVTSFLDEDQEHAWNALAASDGGLLSIPGGRGKTVLACMKIAQRKKAAIVVIPTLSLFGNWRVEIEDKLGVAHDDIGEFIGSNYKAFDKPIVLASLASLANKLVAYGPSIRNKFGTVIFDEAHHLGAPTYIKVAHLFRGCRFGFTATPNRPDGKMPLYVWHLGGLIYRSSYHSMKPKVVLKLVRVSINENDRRLFDRRGVFNFSLLWGLLGKEASLNDEILLDLDQALEHNRVPMVLTRSVPHARQLYQKIKYRYGSCGLIEGGVKWKRRLSELLDNRIVVGTLTAGAEGLNKLSIDTVLLTMPIGRDGEARFLQSVFRALRAQEGKPIPIVVAYIPMIGPGMAMARIMREYAERKGWLVETTRGGLGELQTLFAQPDAERNGVRGRIYGPQMGLHRGSPRFQRR